MKEVKKGNTKTKIKCKLCPLESLLWDILHDLLTPHSFLQNRLYMGIRDFIVELCRSDKRSVNLGPARAALRNEPPHLMWL